MLKESDVLLGKYKLISLIATGGMGNVWLAEDLTLKKKWAVKEIFKDSKEYKASVNPDGTLTEIEILTALDNPYAPRIVDRYEDTNTLAVVMDYVEGQNLLQIIKDEGPQDENKVIEWAICICDLLSFLHNLSPSIIYNDMKPENIILKSDGSIKVIDYGIAKIPDKYPNTTPIGTPGYASPEHYQGKTDARSDIYSLGVTIYHLLTGDNPAVKNFRLPQLRSTLPRASKKLEAIISTATQKSPDKRFQTAAEFKDALQKYQMSEQLMSGSSRTVLLNSDMQEVQPEEAPVQEEKQTPAVELTMSPAANLFTVIFDKLAALGRFILFLIIGVLLGIGITTLLEPTLRSVFFELIRNIIDLIT